MESGKNPVQSIQLTCLINNMKIVDTTSRVELNNVCLFLNPAEASELRDTLELLLKANNPDRHEHVSSADYTKEIILVIGPDRAARHK